MKLLLRRDQKKGLLGSKIIFTLDARAELSADERAHIDKYKLGDTLLYTKLEMGDPGGGLLGVASRLAFKMINVEVRVKDLVSGKHLECKDIVEMLAIEEQLKEASKTFRQVLEAAARFGGEEVVEV